MTRRDTLVCEHEPFGDAFYYGPERLSERFEKDPEAREQSGFSQTTYKDVFDRIEQDASQVRLISSPLPPSLPYIEPSLARKLKRVVSFLLHIEIPPSTGTISKLRVQYECNMSAETMGRQAKITPTKSGVFFLCDGDERPLPRLFPSSPLQPREPQRLGTAQLEDIGIVL